MFLQLSRTLLLSLGLYHLQQSSRHPYSRTERVQGGNSHDLIRPSLAWTLWLNPGADRRNGTGRCDCSLVLQNGPAS